MGCHAKGGSSRPMQCVWKEGECELNPRHNMWLLGAQAMFGSVRKFGERGTEFCVQSVKRWREAADEFRLECLFRMCW